MSDKLFQNKSKEGGFPKKEFKCLRCNQELIETDSLDSTTQVRESIEHPYTYYKGKLVCMKCYHESKKLGI